MQGLLNEGGEGVLRSFQYLYINRFGYSPTNFILSSMVGLFCDDVGIFAYCLYC